MGTKPVMLNHPKWDLTRFFLMICDEEELFTSSYIDRWVDDMIYYVNNYETHREFA